MKVVEEYSQLLEIASRTGGGASALGDKDTVYMVVHANKIIGKNILPGVEIDAVETAEGIDAVITVTKGTIIEKPVHMCFGHLGHEGKQVIKSKMVIEDGARAEFLAHCIFPNAVEFLHAMEGEIQIGENASFAYREVHVHGREGKIKVRPKSKVVVGGNSSYIGDFTLVEGRVGDLDIEIEVEARGAHSHVDIRSKIYGKYDDICKIKDVILLNGEGSSALVKARVVLKDESKGSFLGLVDGAAAGARGHVDCTEVVQGRAVAEASPVVRASHPEAEVTHEAAIGRIADEKIEGLMAKGLSEEESIEVIVSGLLR
ncbi:SufD family Fe-S cluster assembly protein [Thermovirga sp.]|uniref:SufB/SufD family protein n=1 Tax=Thermovirga sp. TaxID=2699834 RepID=UPI0025FA8596|nr:SufD family Fe-S cluster assembly protein [Thermovirga sp.]MBO8153352.1 SufD family Fe-S cluster assembly protein [Thermovirga sp.]